MGHTKKIFKKKIRLQNLNSRPNWFSAFEFDLIWMSNLALIRSNLIDRIWPCRIIRSIKPSIWSLCGPSYEILFNLSHNNNRAYVAAEEGGDTGSNHYSSLIYNDDFEQGSIQWKLIFTSFFKSKWFLQAWMSLTSPDEFYKLSYFKLSCLIESHLFYLQFQFVFDSI